MSRATFAASASSGIVAPDWTIREMRARIMPFRRRGAGIAVADFRIGATKIVTIPGGFNRTIAAPRGPDDHCGELPRIEWKSISTYLKSRGFQSTT